MGVPFAFTTVGCYPPPNPFSITYQPQTHPSTLAFLSRQAWQAPVMKVLATWLAEDPSHVEPKLVTSDAVRRVISIFESHRRIAEDQQIGVLRLLDSLHSMLAKSKKLAAALSLAGLPAVLAEMMDDADAMTAAQLLKAISELYSKHPKAKEFVAMYPLVVGMVRQLACGGGVGEAIQVRQIAQALDKAVGMEALF